MSTQRDSAPSGSGTEQRRQSTVKKPPGLVGDFCDYVYGQAHRPVPEITLCAAIGLMSGICGRAYNTPTGAGLNMCTILIAQTGTGKEAMASGIHSLIEQARRMSPAIKSFVGPARFASAPALSNHIGQLGQVSFVSIIKEFGFKLREMCNERNPIQTALRGLLIELFSVSGKGNWFGAAV